MPTGLSAGTSFYLVVLALWEKSRVIPSDSAHLETPVGKRKSFQHVFGNSEAASAKLVRRLWMMPLSSRANRSPVIHDAIVETERPILAFVSLVSFVLNSTRDTICNAR
jgi:hypothetical protein